MDGTTENTSPIVNQAAPTDATTEESGEMTVQLAQAAAAVQVASPGRGAEDSIEGFDLGIIARAAAQATGLSRRRQTLCGDVVLRLPPSARREHPRGANIQHLCPRMHVDSGRVVFNFIVQALMGEPITVYGDGRQTRSFRYVDDIVKGLVKLMHAPGYVVGPVNLGNPIDISVRALAEMIIDMTGSKSPIVFKPLPQDDPRQRQPDIDLARKCLAWEPVVPLKEGLVKTIQYFDRLLAARTVPQLLPLHRVGETETYRDAAVALGADL